MNRAIPVRVVARSGGSSNDGRLVIADRPLGVRLREAAVLVAAGLAGGILLLPIPLVHLFGITFAIACLVMAVGRLRTTRVVTQASGTCPRCGHAGQFPLGAWKRAFALPFSTGCGKCGVPLTVQSPDERTEIAQAGVSA